MENPFVLESNNYKRNINPKGHYIKQATEYLSRMTGDSQDKCKEFIIKQLSVGGKFEFKDPVIEHTVRPDYQDRHKTSSTVLAYIGESIRNGELIAPTLTTYVNPKEKESLLVSFIRDNVKYRGVAKKKMFAAEMLVQKNERLLKESNDEQDKLSFLDNIEKFAREQKIQKSVQANKKTSNNSLSGAHVSSSTPLTNKTAHSTLTSTCRSTAGYGNANNEKFVAGNRHYHSFDVTLNNIVSITTNSDYDLIAKVMAKHGIRAPTIQETMDCIRYSAMMYWREESNYQKLENYVSQLNDLERAAFVYTGDFYHVRKYNDAFTREFIRKLSLRVPNIHPDTYSIYKNSREDVHGLASQICNQEMKGVDIKDAFEIQKDIDGEPVLDSNGKKILLDVQRAGVMASTIENIDNVLAEYSEFIKAFWVSDNLPASVSHFPTAIRRVALVSDTDSTIFTVQDWIKWYFGDIRFTDEALGVCASVVFLASQTITHILAMMSANFGVGQENIHLIAMKNEFRFDVFVPTQIAKHYYAYIGCQEGNVYSDYKKEIKGVHLKSSNAPRVIMETAEKMMTKQIMGSIIEGKKIRIADLIQQVADIERAIKESVKKGEYDYLRLAQIKESESYVLDDDKSPYQHYTLWNEVFGPKYGVVPPPPYVAIKVSTTLNSRRKMVEWVESIKDKELAQRMSDWLERNGKKNGMGTFQLPDQILSSTGFPEEIFEALDIRRIINDATGVFYIVLETLGFYMLDKKRTKLISDFY